MENEKLKFIVCAPSFDENSGGCIALHRLCDLLNKNAQISFLYPYYHSPMLVKQENILKSYISFFINYFYFIIDRIVNSYKTNKNLNTPIINKKEICSSNIITIYPEIVSGNPLNSKHVVRWLLHKPGFHTGTINYEKNDIFFFYQIIFNDPSLNPHDDHLLTVLWLRDDIYKQTNFGSRSGTCYMLRKGKNRNIIHDTNNSILLDGKSHHEIATIMNNCEYFISYDMETMYSQYAVLCGCKSIVIPEENLSKEEWQPKKEWQYGIAYGFDDIENAEKTKHLVYDVLKNIEFNSNQSVNNFINKIYKIIKT